MTIRKIIMVFLMLFTLNKVSAQQITSAELQVTGLTCSMCSQATEQSLKTLPYISDINPDLNKNLYLLTFKKDADVNIDQLQKKVKDAGFSVGKLAAIMHFDQARVDENGQLVIGGAVYRFENVKNKTLNGAVKVNVLDKDFISSSAFKKNQAKLKFDSYASGSGTINGKKVRIYHLSI